jgi:hypothetical protein
VQRLTCWGEINHIDSVGALSQGAIVVDLFCVLESSLQPGVALGRAVLEVRTDKKARDGSSEISPALRDFIDAVIVHALVRKWWEEHQTESLLALPEMGASELCGPHRCAGRGPDEHVLRSALTSD